MKVFDLGRQAVGAALAPLNRITHLDALRLDGRHHRRSWADGGRAHIEVLTGRSLGSDALAAAVKVALEDLDAVRWAEVNGTVGRVVVAFDPEAIEVAALVECVEEVEAGLGIDGGSFSFERPEQPGDGATIRRAQFAIVADITGLGIGVFGSVLRATPLPIELAGLVPLIDSQPRLRHLVSNRIGSTATDIGFATATALGHALSQGPSGLLVDLGYRASILSAAQARQRAWQDHAFVSGDDPAAFAAPPIDRVERPQPLPRGPVETFADRAALASIASGAAFLAATGSVRHAGAVALAGTAKPARYGREGFVAHLGRRLAGRDILVMDADALRRLDRVDVLVLDAGLLVTTHRQIDHVAASPDEDHLQIHARLRALFDPAAPTRVRRAGGWRLGPLPTSRRRRPDPGRLLVQFERDDRPLLELCHHDRRVAVLSLAPELDPDVRGLVALAQNGGLTTLLGGGEADLASRVGVDRLGGLGTVADQIRELQSAGAVVMLVAGGDLDAHHAADVAVGVARGPVVPWGADLIADDLADAGFLVDSALFAHQVSRQSAALSLAASSTASVLALIRPAPLAAKSVSNTLNLMSVVAFGNGTRAAMRLGDLAARHVPERPKYHELTVAEVLAEVGSARDGLAAPEARRRQVPRLAARPAQVRFALAVGQEVINPLTPVLVLGAAASAALGSTADAAIVGAVTGLNALIGGSQRFAAQRAVDALTTVTAPVAHVRREGESTSISVDELVVGDVVLLEAGDTVPADCRVIDAAGVEVDEAAVTGESVPVSKDPSAVFAPVVAERSCMLYEGTTLVVGSAAAVVVAIGLDTEAARDVGTHQAPAAGGVEAHLGRLTALAIPVAAGGGALVVAAGLLHGRPLRSTMASGVSLAVAAVPEGLPMVTTLAQLAAARRLSTRGALVRNPRAMEALGRVDVLCTDKTGTLTEGRIELRSVSDGQRVAPVLELGRSHRGVVAAAARACPEANEHRRLAHPTDQAVLDGAAAAGVDLCDGATGWRRIGELAFEPNRGLHATWAAIDGGDLLSVKGAPETILPRCSARRRAGTDRRLTVAARQALFVDIDRLAAQGLRILAVAERRRTGPGPDPDAAPTDDDIDDLTFLGLLAMADPVRPTAAAAIAGLRRAGVTVVMVTGDHPSTAEGIAAELGLLNGHRVITGADLDRLDAGELASCLDDVSVFARVTPADKVRIVAAYQAAGRTVAMTGDGANDAPAIRLADVGIALGERCTPAARLAADVVITDDRVETIVDAIIEGRAMWRSVREALAILLGGNVGEIAFTVAATAVTGVAPLSTRQILIVNLLTDVAPALAIATRPPRLDSYDSLVEEGPDQSLGAALNQAIAARAATTAVGAFTAWGLASLSGRPRRASTVGLVAVVGTQLGQTLVAGGRDVRVIGAAVGSAVVLTGIVQTPGLSQYFGCTPLGPVAWSIAAGSATTATLAGVVAPTLAQRLVDAWPRRALPARRSGFLERLGGPLEPAVARLMSQCVPGEQQQRDGPIDHLGRHESHPAPRSNTIDSRRPAETVQPTTGNVTVSGTDGNAGSGGAEMCQSVNGSRHDGRSLGGAVTVGSATDRSGGEDGLAAAAFARGGRGLLGAAFLAALLRMGVGLAFLAGITGSDGGWSGRRSGAVTVRPPPGASGGPGAPHRCGGLRQAARATLVGARRRRAPLGRGASGAPIRQRGEHEHPRHPGQTGRDGGGELQRSRHPLLGGQAPVSGRPAVASLSRWPQTHSITPRRTPAFRDMSRTPTSREPLPPGARAGGAGGRSRPSIGEPAGVEPGARCDRVVGPSSVAIWSSLRSSGIPVNLRRGRRLSARNPSGPALAGSRRRRVVASTRRSRCTAGPALCRSSSAVTGIAAAAADAEIAPRP